MQRKVQKSWEDCLKLKVLPIMENLLMGNTVPNKDQGIIKTYAFI